MIKIQFKAMCFNVLDSGIYGVGGGSGSSSATRKAKSWSLRKMVNHKFV